MILPRFPRTLLWILLGLSIGLGGGYWYARQKVEAFLVSAGLGGLQFRLTSVTRGEAVLADVSLDGSGTVTARKIIARYTLESLRRGAVTELTVKGLSLPARETPEGWAFGALDHWIKAPRSPGAAKIPVPFARLAVEQARVRVESRAFTGEIPWNLTVDATRSPMRARFDSTGLVLPGTVTLETLAFDGDVTLSPPKLEGKVSVQKVSSAAQTPMFTPLSLTSTVEADTSRARIDGKATAIGLPATVPFKVDAEYQAATEISVPRTTLTFGEALQPAMLSPLMPAQVSGFTGPVTFQGKTSWHDGKHVADLRLTPRKLSFTALGIPVRDIEGEVRMDSLLPPRISKTQTLTAARIDAPVPLEQASVAFRLPSLDSPRLEKLALRIAGGGLRVDRIDWDPRAKTLNAATVAFENVQLQPLLDLMVSGKVSATGSLSGSLPLIRKGGELQVDQAALAADEQGTLVYHADEAGREALSGAGQIVIDALQDFRYQTLLVSVSGDVTGTAGTLAAKVEMRGSNPRLYDGKPIDLTLTLRGDLLKAIRGSLRAAGIADHVQQSISPEE